MTSRNLNQTWRDAVFNQYAADHAADVPFPIRYLISAEQWKKDIFIEIPTKIDVPVFRQAVLNFVRARHSADDPAYEDNRNRVRARVRPPSVPSSAQRNKSSPPQDDNEKGAPGAASNSG